MSSGNSRDTIQGSFLLRPENVLFAEHMSKLFQDVYNNRLFDVVSYGMSLVCCMISKNIENHIVFHGVEGHLVR
jgi:hypothetical protein